MRILDSTDFLLKLLKTENHSISSKPITDVQIDSRLVKSGTLFFGLQGNNVNGSDYAQDAIHRGASCVISNNLDKSLDEKYHLYFRSWRWSSKKLRLDEYCGGPHKNTVKWKNQSKKI